MVTGLEARAAERFSAAVSIVIPSAVMLFANGRPSPLFRPFVATFVIDFFWAIGTDIRF
jgi:hypothetical protein